MEGKDGLLARASRLFDLPADAVAGVPRVEVVGDGELGGRAKQVLLSHSDTEVTETGFKTPARLRLSHKA